MQSIHAGETGYMESLRSDDTGLAKLGTVFTEQVPG